MTKSGLTGQLVLGTSKILKCELAKFRIFFMEALIFTEN